MLKPRFQKSLKRQMFVGELKKAGRTYGGIKVVLAAVFLAKVTSCLYQLELQYGLYLFFLSILFGGFMHKEWCRGKENDQRLEECWDYLEQMNFAFEKTGKITLSLIECQEMFGPGNMKKTLERALELLEVSYRENTGELILGVIEKEYPCEQLKIFHEFMVEAEQLGGKTKEGLLVLREACRRWRIQMGIFQDECRKQRRNIFISVVAGMLLCASLVYLVPDGKMLTSYRLYQIGTVIIISLNYFIAWLALRISNRNWLEKEERYSSEEIERKLLKYLNREKFLGRHALKKILQTEVDRTFSEWLLRLALLVQNQEIAGAIFESRKKCGPVLKYYIVKMTGELQEKPGTAEPYLQFLDEFKTNESMAVMKTLYAVSVGGCMDVSKEVMELLERVQMMGERGKEVKREKAVSSLYALFLTPTLLSSIKLLLDMSMMLISFLAQLGMA